MEIWISYDNGAERHQLPVLPPSIGVAVGNNNQVVNIHEIGDINLIGKSRLREMTIECFFPNQDYSFVTTRERHDPYLYVESIERWRKSGKPIRVTVTDTPFNIAFAIENFKFEERDGSGDVYYSLQLSEYVFTGVKKEAKSDYKAPSKDIDTKGKREEKKVGKSYVAKAGDTLSSIAKRTTGNAGNYKVIAKKNGISNPNVISIGQELQL